MVIFRSNSFLNRMVVTPETARTVDDFPCATWPIVPTLIYLSNAVRDQKESTTYGGLTSNNLGTEGIEFATVDRSFLEGNTTMELCRCSCGIVYCSRHAGGCSVVGCGVVGVISGDSNLGWICSDCYILVIWFDEVNELIKSGLLIDPLAMYIVLSIE
jgi:hypothetical protein